MTEDHISALEHLAKLKAEGTISEADFEAQKARLMGAAADQVQPKPKKPWRTIALVAVAIWVVALLAKAIFHPGDWGTDTGAKAVQTSQASPSPATSASGGRCEQPVLAKGTTYAAARTKLLAAGYLLSKAQPEAGSYCDDSGHAAICQKLPEIQDCSADGYCKMVFQNSAGSATVTTFGNGPDGKNTTVESVSYSCGGNSNPAKQASAAQPAPEPNTANTAPQAQDSPAGDQGSKDAQAGQTADPLEGRYSDRFRQCMASGDAAGGSTSAMLACTTQELQVQDHKLNETYQRLMSSLPQDQREELRDQERIWGRQQAAQCPEGDIGTNGDLARLDQPSCLLSQTIRRTMALENLQAQSNQPQ